MYIYRYIFNVVISKYSILLEKNVVNTTHAFTIPKGVQENLLITLTCLINTRIRNLITLVPRAFLFVGKGERLILVLLCKANLEHEEICASDWLKPMSMLLILVFLCLTFQIWLCITRGLFKVQL